MNISLEQREIAVILDALSTRPYMEVAAPIRKIVEKAK